MKKSVEFVNVYNKRVLLRADFNFPLQDGKITDDTRIKRTIPTIKYLLDHNAKLIICSHLGRPDGRRDMEFTLLPVAHRLSLLLNKEVKLAPDCVGPDVEKMVKELRPGHAILLENLRFHAQEEDNEEEFSKKLASLAEIYVSDAFGTAHRKHASTYGVPSILKPAVAGFLLQNEMKYLGDCTTEPQRPFAVVFGGAKLADKIIAVYSLSDKADLVVIGGAMAYTFLKSQGIPVGKSRVAEDMVESCRKFMDEQSQKGKKILLPIDYVVADNIHCPNKVMVTDSPEIPDGFEGVDIGPKTRDMFSWNLKQCNTVLWNGPLGVFENALFADGTQAVMETVANNVPVSVVGGGDSAAAASRFCLTNFFTHVSTGGGASLEFLEGKELPGIAVLDNI
jgi:3-phosphoglycerate kinase